MPTLQQEAYIGTADKLLGPDGAIVKPETREFLGKFMNKFAAWVETNAQV
jgi:chromate reductase